MIFRAYCPGVVTAVLVYPLVVGLIGSRACREGLLSARSGLAAAVIAGVFHAREVGHNVFKVW